jgi:hypothetical protein
MIGMLFTTVKRVNFIKVYKWRRVKKKGRRVGGFTSFIGAVVSCV